MALTYVKSVQNDGVGTVLTLAIPTGGTVAGDLLVLGVRVMIGVTILSITDTLGHDWGIGIPENPLTVGGDHVDYMFYVGKCLGGANTITITTSSSAYIGAIVQEMTGFGSSGAALSKHIPGTGTGVTVDSGAVDTSDAIEAAVAMYSSVVGHSLATDGVPNNWTNRESTTASKLQSFDQEFTSLQTGVKLHGAITSDTWGALLATFKIYVPGSGSLLYPHLLSSPTKTPVLGGLF